jgi:ABC-2 type transport system ATP-binding protein
MMAGNCHHPDRAFWQQLSAGVGEMIEIEGVSKTYGTVQALKDVSLTVAAGFIVGIVGPNGSGKSTLFRVILGLTPPDDGNVFLAGVVQAPGSSPERRRVAYVPDSDDLYEDLTPYEYTRLTWSVHAELGAAAGQEFSHDRMTGLVEAFGLEEFLYRRCRDLSHGTRRKAQLLATLTCRPDVVVVDEPTNGLDPDQHVVLKLVLRALARTGSTVLLSTHNLGFAETLCDSVVLLRNAVVISGSPAEILMSTRTANLSEAYEGLTGIDRGAIAQLADEAFS